MSQFDATINRIIDENNIEIEHASAMRTEAFQTVVDIRTLLMAATDAEKQKSIDSLRNAIKQYDAEQAALDNMFSTLSSTTQLEQDLLAKAKAQWALSRTDLLQTVSLSQSGQPNASKTAEMFYENTNAPHNIAARNTVQELVNLEQRLNEEEAERAKASYASTHYTMLALGVIAVLMTMGASALLSRNILKQLGGEPAHAARVLQSVADGRLDVEARTRDGDDGSVLFSVNNLIESLRRVIAGQQNLVNAANHGDFSKRMDVTGLAGFQKEMGDSLNRLVTEYSTQVAGQTRTREALDATVSEARAVAQAATRGDLTDRITLAGKSGQTEALSTSINAVLDSMMRLVEQIKQTAGSVNDGAQEISKGNLHLSQRTEETVASLEQTAASMEEMTSTVKTTAGNAAQAQQLALAAREHATRGGTVVGSAIAAMSEINTASRRIADIINVIDEIAFQTNLLALNAAVEAARAGEQGRGFAVVASEVRNLAGRSATAAKEIKALIVDSVEKVDSGSRLVDETGKALNEIGDAVRTVNDVVAEIAAASREQATGIEQVNKVVTNLDTMTQQNAALVEQATSASAHICDQAQNLTSLVAHYRVAGDAAMASHPDTAPLAREVARSAA